MLGERQLRGVGYFAVLEMQVELPLDPLQRVVDRLHVPLEHLGDLLVALAVDVEAQHLGLEVGEHVVEVLLQGPDALGGDDQVGRVRHGDDRQHVAEAALALVVGEHRARERDVVVERAVLLPGRRLDRGDDLPGDAELGERPEGSLQVGVVVPDRLVEADHAFLDDVLAVGADQEVGAGLGPGEAAVFLQQRAQCAVVAVAGSADELVVTVKWPRGWGAGSLGSAEPSGTHRWRPSWGSWDVVATHDLLRNVTDDPDACTSGLVTTTSERPWGYARLIRCQSRSSEHKKGHQPHPSPSTVRMTGPVDLVLGHERRRLRATSARATTAATEAFRDSTWPDNGIRTKTSQRWATRRDRPFPSAPTTSTSGPVESSRSSRSSSPSPSSPAIIRPASAYDVRVRTRLVARATGRCASAPALAFQAEGVTPTARRSGTSTPWAPNAAAERAIAPKLCGSVTPSTATRSACSVASSARRSRSSGCR